MTKKVKTTNNPSGVGGFKKGKSGNPGGRPKKNPDLVTACRERSQKAIDVLTAIMENDSAKDSDRISAAKEILNRAWGTAPSSIEISGPEGQALRATINRTPPVSREEWIKLYGG